MHGLPEKREINKVSCENWELVRWEREMGKWEKNMRVHNGHGGGELERKLETDILIERVIGRNLVLGKYQESIEMTPVMTPCNHGKGD